MAVCSFNRPAIDISIYWYSNSRRIVYRRTKKARTAQLFPVLYDGCVFKNVNFWQEYKSHLPPVTDNFFSAKALWMITQQINTGTGQHSCPHKARICFFNFIHPASAIKYSVVISSGCWILRWGQDLNEFQTRRCPQPAGHSKLASLDSKVSQLGDSFALYNSQNT